MHAQVQACNRHHTAPTASAALGRTLLGTLLIACFKAEGEKTQVSLLNLVPSLHTSSMCRLSEAIYTNPLGVHRSLKLALEKCDQV